LGDDVPRGTLVVWSWAGDWGVVNVPRGTLPLVPAVQG
jgi:hypothetical protein